MPTTIYLVRHGSVVGAETRRFIGHLDVPLSPRGEAEAAALARRLAGVTLSAAYSSDLSRTRRTAELLVASHGLQAVAQPELRELLRSFERHLERFAEARLAVGDAGFVDGGLGI